MIFLFKRGFILLSPTSRLWSFSSSQEMLIMIVAFTGVATEIVVGSALAVMSFSAPRGRISSMEGAPYQGLDSVQATNRNAAKLPTDQWQPRAVIWSIQPNCVSFDAYFYDNDFPNMSDVVWAGSDLTVDLSSPIYFIPHRTECRIS